MSEAIDTSAEAKKQKKKCAISFDYETGEFSGISPAQQNIWLKAYPAVDIENQLARAAAWLIANPKNRKSDYPRFLNSWLTKSQNMAPRAASTPSKNTKDYITVEIDDDNL